MKPFTKYPSKLLYKPIPKISFLNVIADNWYGDATWINSGWIDILFDAWNYSNFKQVYNKSKLLQENNKIEHAFLTHYHADHYGGLYYLLEKKLVRNLYMPDTLSCILSPVSHLNLWHTGTQRTNRFYYLSHVLWWFSQSIIWLYSLAYSSNANIHLVKPHKFFPKESKIKEIKYNSAKNSILYSCRFPEIRKWGSLLTSNEIKQLQNLNDWFSNWLQDKCINGLFYFDHYQEEILRQEIISIIETSETIFSILLQSDLFNASWEDIVYKELWTVSERINMFMKLFHGNWIDYFFLEEWLLYIQVWKDEIIDLAEYLGKLVEKIDMLDNRYKDLIDLFSFFLKKLINIQKDTIEHASEFWKEAIKVLGLKKERNNFGIIAKVNLKEKEDILITGDMSLPWIVDFVNDLDNKSCKYIKVSHHGSRVTHHDIKLLEFLEKITRVEEYFIPNKTSIYREKSGGGRVIPHAYFIRNQIRYYGHLDKIKHPMISISENCLDYCNKYLPSTSIAPHSHFIWDYIDGISFSV